MKRAFLSVTVLLLGLAAPTMGQVIGTPTEPAPVPTGSTQRDQEALLILSGAIGTAGGAEQLATIKDFTETGTITYYWAKQATGNVSVKCQGHDRLKIDADLPDGKQTTVISNNGGTIIEPNGFHMPITGQSLTDLGSLTLPSLTLLDAMQDTSVGIVYRGMVTHNGVQVYDVRLLPSFPQAHDLKGSRSTDEARDFYIDPKTLLIISVADTFHVGDPASPGTLHEIAYSNYQQQNGVLAPFAITESVRGNPSFTMTISQATFNSGLVASDFAW